jgi:hypothetical protein
MAHTSCRQHGADVLDPVTIQQAILKAKMMTDFAFTLRDTCVRLLGRRWDRDLVEHTAR